MNRTKAAAQSARVLCAFMNEDEESSDDASDVIGELPDFSSTSELLK